MEKLGYEPQSELPVPPSARVVRAFGNRVTESLNDEYKPSPERRAAFVGELRALDSAERESVIEDSRIRL